ncbi:class I SAM-dependent methyltransferase [Hyphomicrobium sp. NDB2Meth4]|uniref:class I SAM-dependent methyltransferase n=1 Tax=Hyphomicrobium sp. NDB2Meth4 TaxID=1892846 RepID=UPI0009FAE4B0|nr:class I SAM-dependent methyltransferase [Hyphomicrobium sp. NDB2Meth4]
MSQTDYRQRSAVLERHQGRVVSIGRIDESDVLDAYRRWAPVYDYTFGLVAGESRRHAVQVLNQRQGRILEVGVGTGLSLPDYKRHLEVVGIDLSPEMLEKARERVNEEKLDHVTGLHEMDASDLKFADGSFDIVVAMFVMTVVPDPEKVMRELSRVVKPGGEVMLVNHFSQREGVRGWVERRMAPFADKIGWRSIFDQSRVEVCDDLELLERKALRPFGLFTMMRFAKRDSARQPVAAE